jgi:hypothetical protein
VPVLGFVIAEKDVTWPPEWIEREPNAAKSLQQFKAKVKKKIIRPWRNHSELRAVFVESLATAINVAPRPGWIRAPAQAGSDIAQTLSNLAEENARLRKMIHESSHVSADEVADVVSILHQMTMPPNVKGQSETTFAYAYQHYIASELLRSSIINLDSIAKSLEVDPSNVQVLMGDLEFFKVIQVSNDGGYALTELGRRVLLRLFAA